MDTIEDMVGLTVGGVAVVTLVVGVGVVVVVVVVVVLVSTIVEIVLVFNYGNVLQFSYILWHE